MPDKSDNLDYQNWAKQLCDEILYIPNLLENKAQKSWAMITLKLKHYFLKRWKNL